MDAMKSMRIEPGQILCLDGFLKRRDCALLVEGLRYVWWWSSQLAYIDPNGNLASARSVQRTSSTSSEEWMDAPMRRLLRRLERRLTQRLGIAPGRLEPWQAVRYRRGQYFDEHHDAGFFATSPDGERTHSFIVYLDDHTRGGAIIFPRLKQRFRPQAGRLLAWRNLLDDGTIDPQMIHAGAPARRTKTILTTWARQRSIRS
jgi:prolyl 4-hydroxylase